MFGGPENFDALYSAEKELGRGTFGVAYVCRPKDGSPKCAVKVIKKSMLTTESERADVAREVDLMKTLNGRNPHVVTLHGAFEDHESVQLVLELCSGGELFDRIIEKKSYSEKDAASVVRQMLEVVAVCHLNGIIHRDLKPENFLFDSEGDSASLKVTDFGLSTFFKAGQRFTDVVGSAYYIAPEVLQRGYGPECDVWSVGIIMYIVLCGKPPFYGRTESAVFNSIMKSRAQLDQNFKKEPWTKMSAGSKKLIKQMLNPDPRGRITAAQALASPWISIDGVAPSIPLDISVVSAMKEFTGYSKLKQLALRHMANALDEDELRELRSQFAMMDVDGDGVLTLDEMITALRKMEQGEGRTPISEEEIREIVESLDYDGDGQIDYMEFVTAAMHIGQKQRGDKDKWKGQVQRAFSSIDKDGNGMITAEELNAELSALGETKESIAELIKEHDTDGDGMISFEEFSNILRARAASRTRSRAASGKFDSKSSRGSKGSRR
jgi:calcium-dependent protein kinase